MLRPKLSLTVPARRLRSEHGFTLIELLVSMIIALVVSLAAFAMLEFTTNDVSRITERTHVTQTARVALEKIMEELHSACVAPTVTPILPESNGERIKFISEYSPLNERGEPASSLSTVREHEIIYTSTGKGTLTEKSWSSEGKTPAYTFTKQNEFTERKLLTGVSKTVIKATGAEIPIFQYYRYYKEGETGAILGELDPNAITITGQGHSAKEEKEIAEKIAKVTISFTLAPEGHESIIAKGDQPIALEDSAIFRLAPSSESSSNPNLPCTEKT